MRGSSPLLILLCPWLLACSRDTPGEQATPTVTASASNAAVLPWTIDDKGVEVNSALAIGTREQRSWRVSVSSGGLSCEQLAASYPDPLPANKDHQRLDMWFVQSFAKDGRDGPWAFRSASFSDHKGGRGLRAQGSLLKDVTRSGNRLRIDDLELALQDRRGGLLINYSGSLDARACPRVARAETDKPQPRFTLRIAKKTFPVRGATLRPEGATRRLRLTGVAHNCRSALTQGYDWYLDFLLAGKPPIVKLVSLQGDRFLDEPARSKGLDGLQLQLRDTPRETHLKLKGSIKLGDYDLQLEGRLQAVRCELAPASKPESP